MSCRRIFYLATICALNTQLTSAYRLTDNGDQSGKQIMADAIKAAQVNPWMSTFEDSTLMPLSEMKRRPVERKKWGVDNDELLDTGIIARYIHLETRGSLEAYMQPWLLWRPNWLTISPIRALTLVWNLLNIFARISKKKKLVFWIFAGKFVIIILRDFCVIAKTIL